MELDLRANIFGTSDKWDELQDKGLKNNHLFVVPSPNHQNGAAKVLNIINNYNTDLRYGFSTLRRCREMISRITRVQQE